MDDVDKRAVSRLMHVIHRFRLIRQTMPVHLIEALLRVALDEGKSVKHYAQQSAVSTSVMSRHLLDLGTEFRNGEQGLGLIEKKVAAHSLREHEVYLTLKGRKTIGEISSLLLLGTIENAS
jgi:hypothetical protein